MEMVSMAAEDFKSKEQYFFNEGCEQARRMCREWLESLDADILKRRDKEVYRCVDIRETTIKTLMGEVVYARRYYRVRDALGVRYAFLLDEFLALCKNGQLSGLLTDVVVDACMNMSFRKAAATVSAATGQVISHGGAWRAVQERGAQLSKQEERLAELNDMEVLHGEIETKVLFEEQDGVWLSMQGDDRPPKAGKRELKVATHYRGWEPTGDKRYRTVDKVSYAGFENPKEFQDRREGVLAQYYDVDAIDVRILNGDGAVWIKGREDDVILQLDPFHRSRALIRGITDKSDRAEVRRLLDAKDVDGALCLIEKLSADKSADERDAKRIMDLHRYFFANKDSLLSWDERGVELPPPPDGIVYRRLGTQEHSNCDLITHRMKRRKASWSLKGGGHMAKLLCRRATGDADSIFDFASVGPSIDAQLPLTAAQTPLCDGKGYNGGVSHGAWPFDGVSRTEGRMAIRSMFQFGTP